MGGFLNGLQNNPTMQRIGRAAGGAAAGMRPQRQRYGQPPMGGGPPDAQQGTPPGAPPPPSGGFRNTMARIGQGAGGALAGMNGQPPPMPPPRPMGAPANPGGPASPGVTANPATNSNAIQGPSPLDAIPPPPAAGGTMGPLQPGAGMPPGAPPPAPGGAPMGGGGPLNDTPEEKQDNQGSMMRFGGIIDKPTRAILGDDGPEAVVPLHPGMSGGNGVRMRPSVIPQFGAKRMPLMPGRR